MDPSGRGTGSTLSSVSGSKTAGSRQPARQRLQGGGVIVNSPALHRLSIMRANHWAAKGGRLKGGRSPASLWPCVGMFMLAPSVISQMFPF